MAKTKSTHQSETTKPSKPQHETPNHTTDDAVSEKLHNLKSLNAMLLKETVERRQQVDSLTQVNQKMELELGKCVSDKGVLESELRLATERAVELEVAKGVSEKLVEEKVDEMKVLKAEMMERVGGLEMEVERVERVRDEKEAEIGSLASRVKKLEGEIEEERFILSRVSEERDAVRGQLEERVSVENGLRVELAEAEKRESVVLGELKKVKVDYDGLVKEKVSVEKKMDLVLREKDSAERNLVKSNGLIEELKRDIVKISEEKMAVEHERNLKDKEKMSVEKKMEVILREKDTAERNLIKSNELIDDLKRDIKKIAEEKAVVGKERHLQEKKKNELQKSVDVLNESVRKLQEGETRLLNEVAELEKKCVVSGDKEVERMAKIDILVKEKEEAALDFEKLTQEKSLVARDLDEALKNLRNQNIRVNQLAKEKKEINDAKIQAESNVVKFNEQLEEFKNMVAALEKTSGVQTDKIKQLEAEKSRYIAALDQVTKVRNSAQLSLDGEKQEVKHLTKNISQMEKDIKDLQKKLSKTQNDTEKLVAEKKDMEKTRVSLENEIVVVKKSLAKTQKELDDTKGKLRLSEANASKILKLLKNICNSKKDDKLDLNQEAEFGEEIKHHVTEVKAIKKALNDREGIADEMKKQLEVLKVRVAKADKGKSFWTMVSSATTMLAAISLAYVARGGY